MRKLAKALILCIGLLVSYPALSHQCTVYEPGLGARKELLHSQIVPIPAKNLSSRIGHKRGEDIIYNGRADGGVIAYGPYKTKRGSRVRVNGTYTISTNWKPRPPRGCVERDYSKNCVKYDNRTRRTGFTVDYMIVDPDSGKRVILYKEEFRNLNRLNRKLIPMPIVDCKHDIDELEVRIYGAYEGSVEFTVHELELDWRWKD